MRHYHILSGAAALAFLAGLAHASGPDTPVSPEEWSVHAQATGVLQGYPAFAAPYSGPESLPSHGQTQETFTSSLYLGRSLWDGGEVYVNPEILQGIGLAHSFGVAGFPNGEATKAGTMDPRLNLSRLFIRQTFGFGGPTETVEAGPNQLAKTEDISRLTLTAGKIAATDMFDGNRYSHDSTTQFLNWSLMDSGAWDFPADAKGYTEGIALEYNQQTWTLRYGAFLEPEILNGERLARHGDGSVGQVAQLDERYLAWQQPGTVRFLVFYNRNHAGNFSDALALPGNVSDTIDQTRSYGTPKYGFAISADQQLGSDLGAFLRLSWNDGKTEDWAFTQIDHSVAGGLSLQGTRWGRGDDTVGAAIALNGISSQQQQFLQAGGSGLIIGDGQLHYGLESIFESYYAYKILPSLTATADYQFILNPAYNQDRGPVNVFAARLHFEL